MKTTPSVNLGGNTRGSLVDQAVDIRDALMRALKLIAESDLDHGRNYPGLLYDYQSARKEKMLDCVTIRAMVDEYGELALHIQNQ